jgi:hypothetical protein
MINVRVEHVFSCSEETFWDEVFFSEEYNRRLFLEHLSFPVWRELEREDRGGELQRVVEVVPKTSALPPAIQKAIGDGAGYRELGVFDRAARRYRLRIEPTRFADKVGVEGELRTEPAGEGKCKRLFTATVTAKVFGIGGMLEKHIANDLERSYEASASFTRSFIAEKGL